jgi:molybdopterin synthase catalytic subunit
MAEVSPSVITEVLPDDASMTRFAETACPAEAGALVTFAGVVRNHDGGKGVTELEYVGHPSAPAVLRQCAEEVALRHPLVTVMRVGHRTGVLGIGDCALLVEVASPHRAEAFAACRELVEEVKRTVPVRKRQVYTDGSQEWVNSACADG